MNSRTLITLVLVAAPMAVASADILIDFGSTASQIFGDDENGNRWNNVTGNTDDETDMIDMEGNPTLIDLTVSGGGFVGASDWNDGIPAASMYGPFASTNALKGGLFENANETATLTISGLDAGLTYNLVLTGGRDTTAERFTRYTVGAQSVILQTSGDSPAAGTGVNWNNDDVVTINGITGVTSFNLAITGNTAEDFTGAGTFAYLAAMQIQVIPEPTTIGLLGMAGLGILAFRRRRV